MATLEELQARIQRLEDIKQIERLQRIYGPYPSGYHVPYHYQHPITGE